MDGGGGQAPCGRSHRKLELESTDVILSSYHANKLESLSVDGNGRSNHKLSFDN